MKDISLFPFKDNRTAKIGPDIFYARDYFQILCIENFHFVSVRQKYWLMN